MNYFYPGLCPELLISLLRSCRSEDVQSGECRSSHIQRGTYIITSLTLCPERALSYCHNYDLGLCPELSILLLRSFRSEDIQSGECRSSHIQRGTYLISLLTPCPERAYINSAGRSPAIRSRPQHPYALKGRYLIAINMTQDYAQSYRYCSSGAGGVCTPYWSFQLLRTY
jgi:hypothetical protein